MTPATEDSDLRTRVVSVEHGMTAFLAWLDAIEKWQRQVEIADARADERYIYDQIIQRQDNGGGCGRKVPERLSS